MAEENDFVDRTPDGEDDSRHKDDSRMQRISELVDAFLLRRASEPNTSSCELVDRHPDLMPELGLQNQIAKRKAALLLKKESEWF